MKLKTNLKEHDWMVFFFFQKWPLNFFYSITFSILSKCQSQQKVYENKIEQN